MSAFDLAAASANTAQLATFGESVQYTEGTSSAVARIGIIDQPLQGEEYDPKFLRIWFSHDVGFSPAVGDRLTRSSLDYRVINVRDDGAGGWRINAER